MAKPKKSKPIKQSRKKAYATGYLTGRSHYRQLKDSNRITVRGSARRGYRRGLKDAHYEAEQRRRLKNE